MEIKVVPSERLSYVPNSGGSFNNDTVTFGPIDILCGDTTLLSFEVEAECFSTFDSTTIWFDDVEGVSYLEPKLLTGGSLNWVMNNAQFNSPTTSWYAKDLSTTNVSVLELKDSLRITAKTYLSFRHRYETEFFWDAGYVQYQIMGDPNWRDLEDHFVLNGYPQGIGFTGNSDDYFGPGFDQSVIDLSFLMDTTISVRFLFKCDESVGGPGINGWYIDDISLIQESGASTYSVACFGDTADITYHYPLKIITGGKGVYVDTSAQSPHTGLDWQQAYIQLRDALATAECNDTIYVATGHYLPTDSLDRKKYFIVKSGVTILGGFPTGGGGDTVARDPVIYPTILSGDIGEPDSSGDNTYRIIVVDSSQHDIVLDGVVLSGASTDTIGIYSQGGAIFNKGQIVLRKVTFQNHHGMQIGYLLYNVGNQAQLILEDALFLLEDDQHPTPVLNKNGAFIEIRNSVDLNR